MVYSEGAGEVKKVPCFCGGKSSNFEISNKCFQWLNEKWIEMEPLKSPRYKAANFVNQDQVWLLGGTQIDKSTEYFDGNTWKPGPSLEKTLSGHCTVDLSDGRVMVIGGKNIYCS